MSSVNTGLSQFPMYTRCITVATHMTNVNKEH